MSEKVICNASPLIFLSKIGRLVLLSDLFSEICVPTGAWEEAIRKPDDVSKNLKKMKSSNAINVFTVKNTTAVSAIVGRLHIGEVEVIIGAGEQGVSKVILDDGYARSKAKQMGLSVTGTLGVLIAAQQKGLIADIDNDLDNLLKTGFRISDSIVNQVRNMAKK